MILPELGEVYVRQKLVWLYFIVAGKSGFSSLRAELCFDFAPKCSVVFYNKGIPLRFINHIDKFP